MLITQKAPAKPTHQRVAGEGFSTFGEFLSAFAIREMTKGSDDHFRLEASATGLGEQVPSDGGFLVQPDLSQELIMRLYETGQIASRVQRVSLTRPTANGLKFNALDEDSRADGSRWGGAEAYWAQEADEGTPSQPKFRQIELNLQKLLEVIS